MALEYSFSPSELDYKAKKCLRCFYIHKHYKINPGDRPPPVFSSFDAVQKPYFKKTNTRTWCDDLPDGEIMDSSELPGKIVSEGLQDNKQRKFKLSGNPDIVIRFKEKGFGIVDFKTTTISSDKAENYRYQLEAYAQIFSSPGSTKTAKTPKLNPITHMGILQFYPEEIINHNDNSCDFKMKTSYSVLKRDEKDFYNYITKLIDLLEQTKVPELNTDCNFCNFIKKQIELKG
tara:strand:- start:478 stop:1173 length:696 start_codon:yes stop_codon:yes gene_type:complete